jgi:uncharacterized repeat protein (TIGR03803 family)
MTAESFRRNSRILSLATLLTFVSPLFASGPPVEQMVHSFAGGDDGTNPDGGLVADSGGNLYGTTTWGGPLSSTPYGTVFELMPPPTPGGPWLKAVIYSFQGGPNDGATPFGTLIFDTQGNLYGTTQAGGSNNTGTVFELSPPSTPGGNWTETVIYFFPADGSQGYWPFGRLIFDGIGNLYGTTEFGGTGTAGANCAISGCGTVFQLKPPATAGQSWTGSVLYNFGSFDGDGIEPGRGLAFRLGSLYGTTQSGGGYDNGTVFRLALDHGIWTETLLYSFTGTEGAVPLGRLILDNEGNLYGTTRAGGNVNNTICPEGCGSVFELSPPVKRGGTWMENTLYKFTGAGDGACPFTAVLRDTLGNIYGTATAGGVNNFKQTGDNGVVFKLKPPVVPGTSWTQVMLRAFRGATYSDGSFPAGDLILINGSGLFGTTLEGGVDNMGTVYNIVP